MLGKEIMKRTILRKNFLWNKRDYNREDYVKQRNYCMSLLRKTEKDYYGNLNLKKI